MKFLKVCWGVAVGLHCLLIANYVVQRIAGHFTGYHLPLGTIYENYLTFTIWFSILTIFATLIAWFGRLRQKKSTRQTRKIVQLLGLLVFGLVYSLLGLMFYTLTALSTPTRYREAIYASPSGEKVVIFQEVAYFFDGSSVYAYQARGPFRRNLGLLFMADYGDADSIKDKFFDPKQLSLTWTANESTLRWELKDTQDPVLELLGAETLTLD